MRQRYPGVPIVTYVNTSAAVKAESDICCTSGNALAVVESLGVDHVIMLPDEFLAQNIAAQTKVKIIGLEGPLRGARTVQRRPTSGSSAKIIRASPFWRIPNARPKWWRKRISPARPRRCPGFVDRERPARVVLLTECSMSDNVAVLHPDVEFIRPCNLCPHMKRITLKNIRHALETNAHEVTIDPAIADRLRVVTSKGCWRYEY